MTRGPLYTVNKSPYANTALQSCLDHMAAAGALLLIEDGVHAALAASPLAERLVALAASGRLHVLQPDLAVRGLAGMALIPGIDRVDHGGFVDLCVAHPLVVPWL